MICEGAPESNVIQRCPGIADIVAKL